MNELIQKALERCGYGHWEATEQNVIDCFLDYVDHGVFGSLSVEEAEQDIKDGDITIQQICYNLLKVR